MSRIFALMSGKGGVGKSTLAAAMAVYYARQHLRVTLLDGDIGLRCVDLMLGLQDRVIYDLGDLMEKRCLPEQALVSPEEMPGLSLLAAPQLMKASDIKGKELAALIAQLSAETDILLIDAPAGVGRGLKNVLGAHARPILVVTPDDVSLRDAERLSSILAEREEERPGLIVNRARPRLIRRGEMMAPAAMAQVLDLPLLGVLPESEKMYRAFLRHESPLDCGDHAVADAVACAASRMLGADTPLPDYGPRPFLRFLERKGGAAL